MNKQEKKEYRRLWFRKQSDTMSDFYIRHLLGLSKEVSPNDVEALKELILLKRAQLRLLRAIREVEHPESNKNRPHKP
jgi:hypothetical protein